MSKYKALFNIIMYNDNSADITIEGTTEDLCESIIDAMEHSETIRDVITLSFLAATVGHVEDGDDIGYKEQNN